MATRLSSICNIEVLFRYPSVQQPSPSLVHQFASFLKNLCNSKRSPNHAYSQNSEILQKVSSAKYTDSIAKIFSRIFGHFQEDSADKLLERDINLICFFNRLNQQLKIELPLHCSIAHQAIAIKGGMDMHAGRLAKVTKLDLHDLGLTSLPPEIDRLVNLSELDVTINNLKTLPKEIGKLKHLKFLFLDFNQLESNLSEIGNLINLEWLSLSYNKLETISPKIGNLKKLKTLLLNNNQLESLPKKVGNLVNLEWISLSNNKLKTLPNELSNFEKLLTLSVSNNPLNENAQAIVKRIHEKLSSKQHITG